ncbi:unnamed protein product [Arctogadus glacialis]
MHQALASQNIVTSDPALDSPLWNPAHAPQRDDNTTEHCPTCSGPTAPQGEAGSYYTVGGGWVLLHCRRRLGPTAPQGEAGSYCTAGGRLGPTTPQGEAGSYYTAGGGWVLLHRRRRLGPTTP